MDTLEESSRVECRSTLASPYRLRYRARSLPAARACLHTVFVEFGAGPPPELAGPHCSTALSPLSHWLLESTGWLLLVTVPDSQSPRLSERIASSLLASWIAGTD
jgi:hypothetical protein